MNKRPENGNSTRIVVLPMKLPSVANLREHFMARARRAKSHRMAAIAIPVVPLPCTVRITRVAPRALDDDNMQSACKALRDGIADRLGVKDNDPRVRWEYAQEKSLGKMNCVQIELTPEPPQ